MRLAAALLFACVAGCSSALRWTPDYYIVERGDTLYSIAFDYRIDQRDLIAWNKLGNGSVIFVGQKLKMNGPAAASGSRSASAKPVPRAAAKPIAAWQWPTDGKIFAGFGATAKTQSGIQIAGRRGQPVRAAAGGEIVYAGSGLVGYGQLLIIKHNDNYLSAYGHNDALIVTEGQRVAIGERIASMGNGPGQQPMLHFEIRRDGQPVDPVGYLPRR